MLQRLSAVIVALLFAGPVWADGHLSIDCEGLDPSKDGDADTAFLCLADYQQRLKAIEGALSKLIDANTGKPFVDKDHGHDQSGIPSGAIVVFENGCPPASEGWSRYRKAHGRFILGATESSEFVEEYRNSGLNGSGPGLTRRKVGEHGGFEEVALSIEQMPMHKHITSPPVHFDPDEGPGHWAPWGGSGFTPFDKGYRNHKDNNKFRTAFRTDANPHYPLSSGAGGGSDGKTIPHNNMPPYIALYFCKKD